MKGRNNSGIHAFLCHCMSSQTLECGLTQGIRMDFPSTKTWAQATPSAFKSPSVPRITTGHSEALRRGARRRAVRTQASEPRIRARLHLQDTDPCSWARARNAQWTASNHDQDIDGGGAGSAWASWCQGSAGRATPTTRAFCSGRGELQPTVGMAAPAPCQDLDGPRRQA